MRGSGARLNGSWRRRPDQIKGGMFMDRRLLAGGLAIVCFSVSALAFTPRTASAVMQLQLGCDGRLANCADNATNNYDDCVCNVTNVWDDCLQMYVAPNALRQSGPTTVEGCVVQLQGDLVKCQVAD